MARAGIAIRCWRRPFYGVALTDEAVGRAALPEIRKRELLEAGHILGIANHFFLDQRDVRYTQDIDEVLGEHWRPGVVLPEVERRIAAGQLRFCVHPVSHRRRPMAHTRRRPSRR